MRCSNDVVPTTHERSTYCAPAEDAKKKSAVQFELAPKIPSKIRRITLRKDSPCSSLGFKSGIYATTLSHGQFVMFNRFIQNVSMQFHELFWDDVPSRQNVFARLELEARIGQAARVLEQYRAAREELDQRLERKEREAEKLGGRIEIYLHVGDRTNAWRYALALDHLREDVSRLHERRRRLRQAYHQQRSRVESLEDLHADLLTAR